MGGIGSGRRADPGRSTTDARHSIDVRVWKRKGLLRPGKRFEWYWWRNGNPTASIDVQVNRRTVLLSYRHRRFGQDLETRTTSVIIAWSECHLGGERPWFVCPTGRCGRRVAILYGGKVFACRHCHGLIFPSQRVRPENRAIQQAEKIRAKLGWKPGIVYGRGPKPKGMHWGTFTRLTAQYDALAKIALDGLAAQLERRKPALDGWDI